MDRYAKYLLRTCAVLLLLCATASATETVTRGPVRVIADPVSDQAAPLDFDVQYVYRSGGRGALKPIEDGSVLHTSDHYKIQFTADEQAYVYVFQTDSSGTVYPLFPSHPFGTEESKSGNPVQAGRTYSIPGPDDSFQLDDQVGEETIYFLALRAPDPRMDATVEQLNSAIRDGNAPQVQLGGQRLAGDIQTRGPKRIVTDPVARTLVNWTKDEHSLLPVRRLKGLCQRCVNRVTFQHR